MPSPRRRCFPPSPALLLSLILLFFSPSALAASGVLGLDIGTEYIKAALVKPGIPLEIVLTKDSKRKETSAVALKASGSGGLTSSELPERLYGGDALALAPRIPGDVYPNLKHLLGAVTPYSDAVVHQYRERYPALNIVKDETSGGLRIIRQGSGSDQETFTVEELLSMELKTIRDNAEAMAGSGVRDVVITIPAFYTAEERRSIERAAELAGMSVLSLVSDGLAVGVNYATSRTFPNAAEGGKPEHHLVFDMGAGSTTATVLRFQGRTVKDVGRFNKTIQEVSVIGTGWDRSLGGDALNDLIVDDMVNQFVDSKGGKALEIAASAVKAHGRTMAKLTREAEKVRQILSANTATSAFFEGLYEDVDFRYKLSRADFETLASDFVGRVSQPIVDSLAQAGLSMTDVDSVILHGGLVRTPFVQSSLEGIVKGPAKLKTNVNADEAAVFGAAFKAAGLSPSFRVKEIRDKDAATYPITMQWTVNGKGRQQTLFAPTSNTGTTKQVPFKFFDDFSFSLSQTLADDAANSPILDVKITNLTASVTELVETYGCARDNISTSVSIKLDPVSGLPAVVKGSASCESAIAEKKGGVVDDVKGFFGFGSKKDQKPLDADEDDEETEILTEAISESVSPSAKATTSSSSATISGKASQNAIATPKLHVVNLSIEAMRAGAPEPSDAEMVRMTERLKSFDKSDQGRRLREDMFNKLEAFTYRVRDMLGDSSFTDLTSEEQKGALETLLGTTSEWLYSDGAQAGLEAVKEKWQALKALVDPITRRKEELVTFPKSLKSLQEALNNTQSLMSIVRGRIDDTVASASSAAAAALSAATPSADPSTTDDLDDLDAETTPAAPASKPWEMLDPAAFVEDDYSLLQFQYETIKEWLTEQLAAHDLLGPTDERTLLTADLDRKAKQLGQLSQDVLAKIRMPKPKVNTSRIKTTKVKTTKTKASSSSSSKGDAFKSADAKSSSTETVTPTATVDDVPVEGTAQATKGKHEEL